MPFCLISDFNVAHFCSNADSACLSFLCYTVYVHILMVSYAMVVFA